MTVRVIKWKAVGRYLRASGVFIVKGGGEVLLVGRSIAVGATVRREMTKHASGQDREGLEVVLVEGLTRPSQGHLVRAIKLFKGTKYNKSSLPFPSAYTRKRGEQLLEGIDSFFEG